MGIFFNTEAFVFEEISGFTCKFVCKRDCDWGQSMELSKWAFLALACGRVPRRKANGSRPSRHTKYFSSNKRPWAIKWLLTKQNKIGHYCNTFDARIIPRTRVPILMQTLTFLWWRVSGTQLSWNTILHISCWRPFSGTFRYVCPYTWRYITLCNHFRKHDRCPREALSLSSMTASLVKKTRQLL